MYLECKKELENIKLELNNTKKELENTKLKLRNTKEKNSSVKLLDDDRDNNKISKQIINKKYNKGEKGELLVIKKVYELIKNKDEKNTELLRSLFGKNASYGLTVCDVKSAKPITQIDEIKKTSSIYKADCLIKVNQINKMFNISIKCYHGSMPSLVNHTPRSANIFQKKGDLYQYVPILDDIIKNMNKLRKEGKVGEDIPIKNILFTNEHKNCIKEIVKYFMFNGSGRGKSKKSSNSMLSVKDPNDISTWKFINCDNEMRKLDYISSIYDNLILSMRDKGMPKNEKKMHICEPWIFNHITESGIIKKKGSLHIRLKKHI